jgi:hypothetical protein
MNPTPNDPPVDEIREIRHKISATFGHDPARLVAYYQELQKHHEMRLLDPKQEPKTNDQAAEAEK